MGRGCSRSRALAGGVLGEESRCPGRGGSVLPKLGFGWEPSSCRLSKGAQRGGARSPAAWDAHGGACSQMASPGRPFAVGIMAAFSPGMGLSRTCLAGGEPKEGLAPDQGLSLLASARAADPEGCLQSTSFSVVIVALEDHPSVGF